MKTPRLVPAVLAMAVTLACATTGVAWADTTTVGSPSLTPNGGTGDSLSPAGAPVFQGDAGGGYVVTSPVTGTITSWSFLSGGVAQGKLFALRVLRANADGINWTAVATSATVGVTSPTGVDAVNGPFGDHVPIQAGDRIALQPVDDNLTPIEAGTFGQDGIRYFTTALADGQSAPLAPGSGVDNGQVVPIQATIQFSNGTLSVVLAGSGSGSVSGDQSPSISCPAACSQKYPAGTVVTLHESPAAGSSFTGWGDACAGTSSTCQVTLDADTTVAATFSKGATTPAPRNTKPPLIQGTPKAGQTLNCSGDTWVGGGIPNVAWFETEVTSRNRLGRSVQIATGRSLVLGDYPPGATIGCTVTFTNAGGSAAANAADVTVLAVIPSLSRLLSSRTRASNSPAIDPTIGFGGKNTCTVGTWAHYPRHYTFEWFALPFTSSKLTPSLRVGTDQTITITGAEESQYLVCRVTASNGAGSGTAVSNRYVVPASNLGVHVNAIEITQGIQTPEVPTRSALNPAANHVSYQGVILPWEDPNAPPVTVKLAEHHATVVRVYANTSVPIGGHAVPGMLLRAFRDGRQLPPGPIESDQLPPSRALPVGPLGENPSNNGLRTDRGGAYTFTLPWDWTTGDVTFEAQTQFSQSRFNAICVVCAEEGTIFLGPEHFNRVTSARIDALAFKLDTNHGTYLPAGDPGPSPAWTQVQAVVPFPLYVPRYLAELDGTGVINATSHTQGFPCITDCTISITKDATDQSQPFYHWQTQQLVQKVIDWANDNDTLSSHFPFGIVPNGLGFGGGVTDNGGGNNILYGDGQPRAMSVDSRPVDGIAHEFHHGLGRQHADLICGGQLKVNGGSESWPPNNDGLLDGVGLDTSSPSPYTILSNSLQTFTSPARTYYDLMSYCTGNGDWISVRNWNRDVEYRAPGPTSAHDASAASYRTELPATPAGARSLAVTAQYEIGSPKVSTISVAPDSGAPTLGNPTATYSLVGLDSTGRVLASAGANADFLHIDHTAGEIVIVGKIAAAGVHEVDILQNGQRLLRYRSSPHAPTVSLLAPRAGSRVGSHPLAVIRWRSHDADGGQLQVTVRYSPDNGRRWSTIYMGPDRGSAVVPRDLLSASTAARVRLYVSDGFSDAIQTTGRFVSLGAPPLVRITSPARGRRIESGGSLDLQGLAYDDTGGLLDGHSLTWRSGRTVLGHGALVTTRALAPGRDTVTLLARDRQGRMSAASVRVTVTPSPPVFTVVRGPSRISRTARSLEIVVASLAPARLTIGHLRTLLGPSSHAFRVPIHPGSAPIRLTLRLRSGQFSSEVLVVVAR